MTATGLARFTKLLDALAVFLAALIALLLATGGAKYASPSLKLELSEIDTFAWALLAALALRRRLSGKWLPAPLERLAQRALAALEGRPETAVWCATGAYVFIQTWLSGWRYGSFHANAFDLGFMDQSLWASAHGAFLHSDLSRGGSYLGEHFSPLLGVFGQFYRVVDTVGALFALQSLALASGAMLVYRLGLSMKLSPRASALAGLCVLAYQPLRLANQFDFREDDLFVPVFLAALLALESRRFALFWAFALLSWTIKESAPLFTFLIGAWLAARSRETRAHGAALAALSLAAFALVNLKVTPHFAGAGAGHGSQGQTMLTKRLSQFGSSNAEILAFAFRNPLEFIAACLHPLLTLKAARYLLAVATPFLWFARWQPLPALIALAGMALNLLVNQPTIGFHYECVLVPFLFYVLVGGLRQLERQRKLGGAAPLALVALSFLLFYGRSPVEAIRRFAPTGHDRFVEAELARIAPDLSVATQTALYPHVDHRMRAVLFNGGADPADVVALDFSPSIDRYASADLERDAAAIDPRRYELAVDRDSFKLWRRRP